MQLKAKVLTSLILLVAVHGVAEAQAFGRVSVVVKNANGEPLQGVKVLVTCPDLPKFREEMLTNKKGKSIVSFTDATKVYDFHFEYEDYQPQNMQIKPQIRQSITREIVLTEGQVVTTKDGSGEESRIVYSPSERVFNEGVVALQAGDMATAKTSFLSALEKNAKMAAAHSALAGVYLHEKDYQSALDSIHSYMELQPDDPNAFFMLYDAHSGLGNQAEADAALEALKKADKGGDTVALIYNAGVAAVKVGNYTTAKARFLEALELDPSLTAALSALAVIFTRDGDYQQAVEYAEKHLAVEPGHQRSLRIRWDAYRELGDEEKAAIAFKDLAAADPKVLAIELYNKGNDLFESGDTAAAIAEFERVIEIDPENARAHYRLGVCHVGAGNTDKAKMHLQKFIEMAPDDPEMGTAKDMLGYLN